MTDYECPTCGGGFPAADADEGCPWCSESFDGGSRTTATVDTLTSGRGIAPNIFDNDHGVRDVASGAEKRRRRATTTSVEVAGDGE